MISFCDKKQGRLAILRSQNEILPMSDISDILLPVFNIEFMYGENIAQIFTMDCDEERPFWVCTTCSGVAKIFKHGEGGGGEGRAEEGGQGRFLKICVSKFDFYLFAHQM